VEVDAAPASTKVAPAEAAPAGAAPAEVAPPAEARPLLRGWLHLVAAGLMLVLGPLVAAAAPTPLSRLAVAFYAATLFALFGVSAAFHRIVWSPPARRRMRRADHSTIFLAIAGTYTAVAVLSLSGTARTVVLALVWGGGIAGVALRQLWLDAPKWAVAIPYVVVGWSALAVIPELVAGLSAPGFGLLLAGGVAYTAGAIVYARKRPDPAPRVFGYHEVFHACTIAGAGIQLAVVAFFAIPRAS